MKPIMFFLWMTIVTIPVLAQQISGTYAIRNVQTGILLRIRDTGKDHYLVKLKGTDLYLTPADDKGTVNAPIVLAPANNTTLQHWTLKEQHPEM